MIYFHVPITIRAVRFETFVIISRHAHVTHDAISHLFAEGLAFQLVCLMFFESRATSKVSVTRLVRGSFFRVHTRRNRLTVATRLSALMCHATSKSFITASAYILSRHRTRKIVYHVIMSLYVVIQQVNSFSDCTWTSKYVLAIQSSENEDPILFEMFLESH